MRCLTAHAATGTMGGVGDSSAPPVHEHLVAFYGNAEGRLTRNVSARLAACLAGRGGAIIIASPEHTTAILDSLGPQAFDSGRVLLIDPAWALERFMGTEGLDALQFDALIGDTVRQMRTRYSTICAYGEMVGYLWQRGAFAAAVALEELWNHLLEDNPCDLICGYPIDVLSEDFQIGSVSALLSAHTKVVTSVSAAFDVAMREAMDDVLGNSQGGLRGLPQLGSHNRELALAPAEATILGLRHTLPRYVEEILTSARRHFERTA